MYICIGDHLRDAISSGMNAVRSRVIRRVVCRDMGVREGVGDVGKTLLCSTN